MKRYNVSAVAPEPGKQSALETVCTNVDVDALSTSRPAICIDRVCSPTTAVLAVFVGIYRGPRLTDPYPLLLQVRRASLADPGSSRSTLARCTKHSTASAPAS